MLQYEEGWSGFVRRDEGTVIVHTGTISFMMKILLYMYVATYQVYTTSCGPYRHTVTLFSIHLPG